MKTIEIDQAKQSLAETARDAASGPVVVTEHGKPIAVMVSIDNADCETISLSTNPQFMALIERSRRRHQQEGGLSSDEVRKRLGIEH